MPFSAAAMHTLKHLLVRPRIASLTSQRARLATLASYDCHYIGNEWVPSRGLGRIIVTDSNSGAEACSVPAGCAADVESACEAASKAFTPWATQPLSVRKEALAAVRSEYAKRLPDFSDALCVELGCTRSFATRVQSRLPLIHWDALLEQIDAFQWEEHLPPNTTIIKEPIGVVGAITPWNYPLHQIALKIGPAFLAGCTVVLKPSEVTPVSAYILTEAVHAAGLPAGVFNMVMGDGLDCGEALASHPKVDMVTFTGSTRAGRRVCELAAGTLKRVRTELGGKSAAIMLDDADLSSQIPHVMSQLMVNSGQSCNAFSRLLVPHVRYEEAVAIATAFAEKQRVTTSSEDGDLGPLASRVQHERVTELINAGMREARLVAGGLEPPPGVPAGGYFVRPTVLADVTNDMQIAQQEVFGPVLAVLAYHTDEEAIQIANDTIYGLNNAVMSASTERAQAVARRLRSGQVYVNKARANKLAPFGGYKQSGDGREWGIYGLLEFLQVKAIQT